MRLLLATTNRGKLRELRALLADLSGVELLTPDDTGGLPEVVEDGETFEANARKKARQLARATALPVLCDDSGLEVDALGGRPGVRSARYASAVASDDDNNRKLIGELNGVPPARRGARYRAVLAFCDPGSGTPVIHTTEGRCEGRIRETPAGTGGFGYDPYFEPQGYACTMAELPAEEKNRISHRARALADMRAFLAEYVARGRDPR
jgi:XTP/dITP diphosphohydrolase